MMSSCRGHAGTNSLTVGPLLPALPAAPEGPWEEKQAEYPNVIFFSPQWHRQFKL